MPISFTQAGEISGVNGGADVLTNPTSLQFGPDGRLYVSEQNGSINAFTVTIQDGQYIATDHEELLLPGGGGVVKSIQNHNDDGSLSANGNRQVTGIVVTGTAEEPVLYISSSDPRIAVNGEVNLDTNSGVVTKVSWNSNTQEWETIDIIRGLPRSEENHSVNGMVLSQDGTKLYLMVGGNTNNGAPSSFFSYTAEYALSGTLLEIDLDEVDALPTLTDPNGGQGGQPRNYKYDLPTLDDPNRANAPETVTQAFVDAAIALQESDIGTTMSNGQLADFGIERVANAALGDFPDANVVITQELFDVFKAIGQDRVDSAFTDAEALAAGFQENSAGLDLTGPWGGNDGLNQAILPADAPLRIYASGFRNAYDIAMMPDGKLYTVDNGSNNNLGDNPNTETGDADGDGVSGEAINTPNNGGLGDPEPLFLIEEGGYYGHPNPTLSNQNQSWTVYNNSGNPDTSVSVNNVSDISALVPQGVQIEDGFLIDPSKMASLEGFDPTNPTDLETIQTILFENGVRVKRTTAASQDIVTVGSSTNGIVAYDSNGEAFDGVLDGKLFVTQFNDNVTLLNLNENGDGLTPVLEEGPDGIFGTADDVVQSGGADGILEVANTTLGVPLANPLDVTVGPNGTLWVAEIGGNEITVLAPSDIVLPGDTDSDDDGIENVDDPFLRDASNGTSVVINPGQPTVWEFSQGAGDETPGPDGFGGGVTGVMIDGTTDFEAFFQSPSPRDGQVIQLDNVKFVTAAGGGTTTIEEVTNGDPFQTPNDGQFLFHTGFQLADNVETFTVKWVVANPGAISGGSDITNSFQQIGGYIGDGTQSNYLKIVAIATNNDASTANIQILLENNDTISQTIDLPANNIFNNAVLETDSSIVFELEINPTAATAIPKATFTTTNGDVTITGDSNDVINLTGSQVLDTILGNNTVQGQTTGIAAGLFASNFGSDSDTFQAVFDSITVTATEGQFPPDAVDDTETTGVNAILNIPVSQLLANDTDPNPADTLTVTGVSNPLNGTVSLDNGIVTFTPDTDFQGEASFDYTITDGTDTDTATVTVTVADEVVLYRVNAGGAEVAALASDPVQIPWAANTGTGAQSGDGFSNNTGNVSTHSIANQNDPGARDASLPDYVPYQVFNQERWDPPAAPEMLWSFDVTSGNTYEVNLFLRNGFDGTSQAGERIFDIEIEGTQYFSDIDLSGTYGHQVAAMLSQTLVVNDDSLDIEFLHDVENPLINAIEIVQIGEDITPPLPVVNILGGNQVINEDSGQVFISIATNFTVPNDETVNVNFQIEPIGNTTPGAGGDYEYDSTSATFGGGVYTDTKSIAGGSSDLQIPIEILNDNIEELSEAFKLTILSVSPNATLGANNEATITIQDDDTVVDPGDVLFRINAGGSEVAASDGGPAWAADQSAVTANGSAQLGTPSPFLVDRDVAGDDVTYGFVDGAASEPGVNLTSAPDALFTTERFSTLANPNNIGYAFDVANGDYTVNLYFDELFFDASGSRIFDVEIEGDLVLDDFDTFATYGNDTGLQSFTTTVTDSVLNLEFLKGAANNPHVAAIEIIAADNDNIIGDSFNDTPATNDDFSNDNANPDDVVLNPGSNTLVAGQEPGDNDYITIEVPEGQQLVEANLLAYEGGTNATFLGIETGDTFTSENDLVNNNAPLEGGTIYDETAIGNDLLPLLASDQVEGDGTPTTGLTLPLGPGTYTLWFGQNGTPSSVSTVELVTEAISINPTLSVTLDPTSISEDGGTVTGTVTRNTDDTNNELTVTLSSDDTSEATVPDTVSIPINSTSATFEVTVEDDTELDGTQTANISATASGFEDGTASLEVLDNDAINTTIRIEAEDITNVTTYRLEGNNAASGGEMLSLVGSGGPETGTATFIFTGPTGSYDINLGTFDESDGIASFTVEQNDTQIGETIVLDQNTTGSNVANDSSKVTRLVGTGIQLVNGATITVTGVEESNEHARFDFIEFTSSSGTTPTPPTAGDDVITTDEANIISGNVLDNDTGTPPLTIVEVNGSDADVGNQITLSSGALLTLNADGSFDYDPNGAFDELVAGETDTDNFTYLAGNDQGVSEATVNVTINGVDESTQAEGLEVLESLDANDGIATGGVYTDDQVGAAELSVMANVNNIQSSNFGAGSFQLTNTGDKKIAAVFIDFRDAVFGDSVVDFDGTGGDTVAKKFVVDGGGTDPTTGAFFDETNGNVYYLPGEPPLENNTGTGLQSSGGFRGLLLKAGNTGNGFEPGENVGFSGDMDPNSIAGLPKSGIDSGAINSWDVGGVSGAEIAGSRFFVLFDDGTTASGVLANNETQAGSIGEAVEGQTEVPVNVIVNNNSGTYGENGAEPTIVVTGPAGQTVKVVLAKGFQPVTNDTNGYEQLVEDRLAESQPEFPVNNAFDFQTVTVTIGQNGTVTVPTGVFNYNETESGVQFAGDDVAPIAISAVAINGEEVAIGPVAREYLINPTQTPVIPVEPESPGYFEVAGSGSNLYYKIQIEDAAALNGGVNPNGNWNYITAPDEEGRQDNFQGTGYYLYGSNTNTGLNQVNENEILEFEIEVPQALVEQTMTFRIRASRDGLAASDQQNDVWFNVTRKDGTGSVEEFLVETQDEPEPTSNGFIKVFGGPNNGNWGYAGGVDGVPGNFPAQIAFDQPGRYLLQVAGRSQGFHIDWIELFSGSAPAVGAANSDLVQTGPQPVQLVTEIPDQTFADGATDIFELPEGTFVDPNGDPIAYQLSVTADNGSDVSGVTINETTGQISGLSSLDTDTYQVTITATDVDGAATDTFEINIVDEIALETLSIPVNQASDDFEQSGGANSADLEFGLNGPTLQEVGVRFNGITIPEGAVISNAYIAFTAFEDNSAPASFTIGIQNSENAPTFTSSADLLSRTTAAELSWSNVEAWTAGQTYQTPNLASLIQQVVETDGVTEGALAFLVNGSGSRAAQSFNNGTPPTLVIEFEPSGPAVPTASLSVTPTAASEAEGTVITVTATASSAVSGNQTLDLDLSGTGITPADFVEDTIPTQITIADGETEGSVTLTVADDAQVEGTETAAFTISNPSSGLLLGADDLATVAIADDEQPSETVLLEAEAANTIDNYRTENIGAASGGEVLSFFGETSDETGSASFTFNGAAGNYNVLLGTFDESDGEAQFAVDFTDSETSTTSSIGSVVLNASLGSNLANTSTFVELPVATEISLTPGDILTVNGFEDGNEHARLDYLKLESIV